MRRTLASLAALAALALAAPAPAGAVFGLNGFDVSFKRADGSVEHQAGTHPYRMTTFFRVNSHEEPPLHFPDEGDIKDLIVEQIDGFVGSATAVPVCTTLDFANRSCGLDTVVGATATLLGNPFESLPVPIYNLEPPPGAPARLGFITADVPLVIDVGVKNSPDYNVIARTLDIPQVLPVFGTVFELWGVPADPANDFKRGDRCLGEAIPPGGISEVIVDGELNLEDNGQECLPGTSPEAFLTLPRACEGPLLTAYELDPWTEPGAWRVGGALTHGVEPPPLPGGFTGCGKLGFAPEIVSRATAEGAASASGLDFRLTFTDEGLTSPNEGATAGSEMKKLTVALPEGMTANASLAEGVGVCSPADLDRETLSSAPGEGCPDASKIGTVAVRTPLLGDPVEGSVFLAAPDDPATAAPGAENPFDTLIALYIVFRNRDQGILITQAGRVEPDPTTGQLISTFEDIPQVPFSRLDFHFREGQRAPLITPPHCGDYETVARFIPWARPGEVVTRTASFRITGGPGGGPCPPAGAPPFDPGLEAGAINNDAGAFSPFSFRLTRADGEQDITRISATLPPGLLGRLAGIPYCPEAAIALARARSGRAELADPACPQASQIGSTLAGAGVGSTLIYVPGRAYLAGPFAGDPLSIVFAVPAVAGPFDVGTVVVRVALRLDPRTAEVEVDGAASDPIPHILAGIPLNVRDLRVVTDRPDFTLNPTSCDESSTRAQISGSFLNLLDPADDIAVALAARHQIANCARLGFAPRLSLRLRGGTRRGDNPALRAVFDPRPGQANTEQLTARLPRSAFLDQSHIRTVCTRVQFAADACPPGARYGQVKVFTPLLDDPLQGPVWLRSSDHKLPDLVFDLHGLVDVEVSARLDSFRGGIRASFESIPDAPISRAVLHMQGGRKGLIVNSRDLCRRRSRASVALSGHNGKAARLRPVMGARCAPSASRAGHRRR